VTVAVSVPLCVDVFELGNVYDLGLDVGGH
jgi:hypothetical protein